MKQRIRSLVIFTMLLLGTTLFISGCATTGMDRSVKTAHSIQDVDSEIRKMIIQMDNTASSLNTLVQPAQPNLKKSYDSYSKNLDKLEDEGKRVLKQIEDMKTQSKEYFAEWEKQGDSYTNPQIRELSDERRVKLAEIYAQIPAAGTGVKGAYFAALTNLKEIKTYLGNDLTPNAVESINPVAQKAVQGLDELKQSLQPVITALDNIKTELYRGKK